MPPKQQLKFIEWETYMEIMFRESKSLALEKASRAAREKKKVGQETLIYWNLQKKRKSTQPHTQIKWIWTVILGIIFDKEEAVGCVSLIHVPKLLCKDSNAKLFTLPIFSASWNSSLRSWFSLTGVLKAWLLEKNYLLHPPTWNHQQLQDLPMIWNLFNKL